MIDYVETNEVEYKLSSRLMKTNHLNEIFEHRNIITSLVVDELINFDYKRFFKVLFCKEKDFRFKQLILSHNLIKYLHEDFFLNVEKVNINFNGSAVYLYQNLLEYLNKIINPQHSSISAIVFNNVEIPEYEFASSLLNTIKKNPNIKDLEISNSRLHLNVYRELYKILPLTNVTSLKLPNLQLFFDYQYC
jgi:hypothetical protein